MLFIGFHQTAELATIPATGQKLHREAPVW